MEVESKTEWGFDGAPVSLTLESYAAFEKLTPEQF